MPEEICGIFYRKYQKKFIWKNITGYINYYVNTINKYFTIPKC